MMGYFKAYLAIVCLIVSFFSLISAHTIIPPQFLRYAEQHPHASIEEMQQIIDQRGSTNEIEGLSGMSSKELAVRLLVYVGSGSEEWLHAFSGTVASHRHGISEEHIHDTTIQDSFSNFFMNIGDMLFKILKYIQKFYENL